LVLPAVAAAGMAATGWMADPRLTTPPHGKDPRDFTVTWHQKPQVGQNYGDRGWGVRLLFRVAALGAGEYVLGELSPVTLKPAGQAETVLRAMEGDRRFHGIAAAWNLRLDESLAHSLQRGPWTATGTLYLRFFDRQHHSLPLKGTHTVEAGRSRWSITPVADPAINWRRYNVNFRGIFYAWEYVTTAPYQEREWDQIARETAVLRRKSDGLSLPDRSFYPQSWSLLWQGAGYGDGQYQYSFPDKKPGGVRATDHEALREELSDPARQDDWTLEFDTLTFAGTLAVPFSLNSAEAPQ
jgi:hypothetical protein